MKRMLNIVSVILLCCVFTGMAPADFVHPGCLSKQADLDRIAAKVAAKVRAGDPSSIWSPWPQSR